MKSLLKISVFFPTATFLSATCKWFSRLNAIPATFRIPLYLVAVLLCLDSAPVFSQTCPNWVLVGDATSAGTTVSLTQAVGGQSGACWNSTKVDLTQDFNLTFLAYLGASTAGADGIDFVLQDDSRGTAAISGNGQPCGSCKGYSGVSPISPSVAFAISTYQTSYGNGILQAEENGLESGGADINTCSYVDPLAGVSCPYTFTQQQMGPSVVAHNYNITWNHATQVLTLNYTDTGGVVRTMAYDRDLIDDVFGGQTQVWFGFTAGTGGANNLQWISSPACVTATPTPTCSGPATAGNPSVGGNTSVNLVNNIAASKFVIPTGQTLSSISLNVVAASALTAVVGIYTDNSGVPGNLITQSAQAAVATGWNTLAIPPTSLNAATTCWLEIGRASCRERV